MSDNDIENPRFDQPTTQLPSASEHSAECQEPADSPSASDANVAIDTLKKLSAEQSDEKSPESSWSASRQNSVRNDSSLESSSPQKRSLRRKWRQRNSSKERSWQKGMASPIPSSSERGRSFGSNSATNFENRSNPPSRSSHEAHRSETSGASSHALDVNVDDGMNESDDCSPSVAYIDVDGEPVYKKSDADKRPSLRRTIYNIIRGMAMPAKPMAFCVVWAVSSVVVSWVLSWNYQPNLNGECRWWCTPVAIDGDALSYVGFALFLLTSFRVQEAYGRYMDAVRLWTTIGGTVTSFAQYAVQAFELSSFHHHDRERLLGFLVAFPVALKRELRNERDLQELKGVLAREDLARLQNATSMSSYCVYVLSSYCLHAQKMESKLPQAFLVQLIRWVADLAAAADSCKQIKTMPAPYSYISHLRTFMALWMFFLPLALIETTGWATIVIVIFIGYGILGMVDNAAELENPFGKDYNDLPLGKLAEGIQSEVAAMYHASLSKRGKMVCAVDDSELVESEEYWLRELSEDEDDT